jgi:hypothetical protein
VSVPNNIKDKSSQFAQSIDGRVVLDQDRVEVCIKGFIAGFPITLEAVRATYPFGVNYFLETSNFSATRKSSADSFKLTVLPKYMQGWLSLISRIFLFESRGQKLDLPQLDRSLKFKYDHGAGAKKFAHYPGVSEGILTLEKLTHFNEMLIKSDAGIFLSQPTAFNVIELDSCRQAFALMAELGQVIFEAF